MTDTQHQHKAGEALLIEIGTIIDDRYEILKEIGRGGMSIVYLAMDNRLNKSLVVKDIRKRENIDSKLLLNSLTAEREHAQKTRSRRTSENLLLTLSSQRVPSTWSWIISKGNRLRKSSAVKERFTTKR